MGAMALNVAAIIATIFAIAIQQKKRRTLNVSFFVCLPFSLNISHHARFPRLTLYSAYPLRNRAF
jgi:hypothetical protein